MARSVSSMPSFRRLLQVATVASLLPLYGCPNEVPDQSAFGDGGVVPWDGGAGTDGLNDGETGATGDASAAVDVSAVPDGQAKQDAARSVDSAAVDAGGLDIAATDSGSPDAGAVDPAPPKCTSAVACTDNNPCTQDDCVPATGCKHTPISGFCTGSGCTFNDTCVAGKCVPGKPQYFANTYTSYGHIESIGSIHVLYGGALATVLTTANAAGTVRHGWYLRADATGKIASSKSFDSNANSGLYDIEPVATGGVVLGGTVWSTNGVYNGWLVRLDGAEQLTWQQILGGGYTSAIVDVLPAADGGFVFAGHIYYGANLQGWLGKVTSTGSPVWGQGHGGAASDQLVAVAPDTSGGYMATGHSVGGLGGTDIWVVRIDAGGNKLWDKHFGGAKEDSGVSISGAPGGGALVFGNSASSGAGGFDAWLGHVDAQGKLSWSKTYGQSGNDWFTGGRFLSDGSTVFIGTTQSMGTAGASPWLARIGPGGHLLWQTVLAGSAMEFGRDLAIENSGRISVSGWRSDGKSLNTAMLWRTDFWGHADCKSAAACLGKGPSGCNDTDPCTVDACSTQGCTHTKSPEKAWCGTGKWCIAGACKAW